MLRISLDSCHPIGLALCLPSTSVFSVFVVLYMY